MIAKKSPLPFEFAIAWPVIHAVDNQSIYPEAYALSIGRPRLSGCALRTSEPPAKALPTIGNCSEDFFLMTIALHTDYTNNIEFHMLWITALFLNQITTGDTGGCTDNTYYGKLKFAFIESGSDVSSLHKEYFQWWAETFSFQLMYSVWRHQCLKEEEASHSSLLTVVNASECNENNYK